MTRIGQGYDVHRLAEGRKLILGGHVHLYAGDGRQHLVGLLPVHDGAHPDLFTVVCGDHDHHRTHRELQHIVIPHHTVYLLLDDTLYDTCSVHGMDDLIPYLKQQSHLQNRPEFLIFQSYYTNLFPLLQVNFMKNPP